MVSGEEYVIDKQKGVYRQAVALLASGFPKPPRKGQWCELGKERLAGDWRPWHLPRRQTQFSTTRNDWYAKSMLVNYACNPGEFDCSRCFAKCQNQHEFSMITYQDGYQS